jgi:hypothetical protein
MSEQKKKPGVAFWATVVVAVLLPLAAYVGAYYGTVLVLLHIEKDMDGTNYRQTCEPHYASDPRWDGALKAFFAPVHWIDRKTMPDRWNPSWGEPANEAGPEARMRRTYSVPHPAPVTDEDEETESQVKPAGPPDDPAADSN